LINGSAATGAVAEETLVCAFALSDKLHVSGVMQTISIKHTLANRSADLVVIKKIEMCHSQFLLWERSFYCGDALTMLL
jgi:hypothetical protein